MYCKSAHGTLGASLRKLDATMMHALRSPGAKGYGRCQPMAPNWRRSHTIEWKKASAKMIALSSGCLGQASHTVSLKVLKARIMLGRSPLGGSFVSLIEFCRICTGITGCGSEERKTRKSGWAPSMSASSFFSSLVSQRATSSTFCSITQPPDTCMRSSAFSATGSWPWPSETLKKSPLASVLSAGPPIWRTASSGSTPGESRKKTGVAGDVSSNEEGRSKGMAL